LEAKLNASLKKALDLCERRGIAAIQLAASAEHDPHASLPAESDHPPKLHFMLAYQLRLHF
jgi:hypothetical protein